MKDKKKYIKKSLTFGLFTLESFTYEIKVIFNIEEKVY
jgi:hypothetical protein